MPRQRKLNKHLNEVRYIPNQPKTLYYSKKMTFRADISYGTRCWQITRSFAISHSDDSVVYRLTFIIHLPTPLICTYVLCYSPKEKKKS